MIEAPRKLYRISIFKSLEGLGGLHAEGRWSRKGRPIVYLADSAASALLEVLAHLELDRADLPDNYQLLEVTVPPGTSVEDLKPPARKDWRHHKNLSQAIGAEWLVSGRTVLARVPSALAPDSFNFLLNPAHADSPTITILRTSMHPYDPRLLKRS